MNLSYFSIIGAENSDLGKLEILGFKETRGPEDLPSLWAKLKGPWRSPMSVGKMKTILHVKI